MYFAECDDAGLLSPLQFTPGVVSGWQDGVDVLFS